MEPKLGMERLNGGQSPPHPQPNVGSYFVLPVDSPIWNSLDPSTKVKM